MSTPKSWQRYLALGVFSAEAPRGYGCVPAEMLEEIEAPVTGRALTEHQAEPTPNYAWPLTGPQPATLGGKGPPSLEEALVAAEREALSLKLGPKLNTQSLDLKQLIDRLPDIPASLRWPEELRQAYEARESDPKGLDPHQPGAKLDAGKVRMGLVMRGFARALFEVGRVGTYGAGKYSPNGWLEVENGEERYMDAGLRHLIDDAIEEIDKDTNLWHLAQAAWNLLAVLELRLRAGDAQ